MATPSRRHRHSHPGIVAAVASLLLTALCAAASSDPTDPCRTTAQTARTAAVPDDANDAFFDVQRILDDPNIASDTTGFPAESARSESYYFQRRYHSQMTQQIFAVLCFPYAHTSLAQHQAAQPLPCRPSDPNTPARAMLPTDLAQRHNQMAQCLDMAFQWRDMNLSPATALEVLRTLKLTHLDTGIYEVNADLAVNAKRTLGHLGRVNRHFDALLRQVITGVLDPNDSVEAAQLYRLDKLLGEQKALLVHLAMDNDQLMRALGRDPFDRSTPCQAYDDDLKFYNLNRQAEPY